MTITETFVNKVATKLFFRRPDRRSFLVSAAVVGSAIAVEPWGFLTRPTSAYATVCGDGASCVSGWTAFCCTVNNGANMCPPGSFAAGWWKADNSAFCCGGARYYVDCNAQCGSNWTCHCAEGTCDQRRVACNQFRYGQCNQQISCYGPVVCRVITCTPPWYDGTCTSAVATDNRTGSHSAPCLPGWCPAEIQRRYAALGGSSGPLGAMREVLKDGAGRTYVMYAYGAIYSYGGGGRGLWGQIWERYKQMGASTGVLGLPTSNVTTTGNKVGQYANFEHGVVLYRSATGARAISHAQILSKYGQHGGTGSSLGFPTTNTTTVSNGSGEYNYFEHGVIFWNKTTGARAISSSAILLRFNQLRSAIGPLGYPTTDTTRVSDGSGEYNYFEHGVIFWNKTTGARSITSRPILDRYNALRSSIGPLGYPTTNTNQVSDGSGEYNYFQHGVIFWSQATGARAITSQPILDRFNALRSSIGPLGYPTTNTTNVSDGSGDYNYFQHGVIFRSSATGAHAIVGQPLVDEYNRRHACLGALGYPISDTYDDGGGKRRVDFEGGSLVYDPSTKTVTAA